MDVASAHGCASGFGLPGLAPAGGEEVPPTGMATRPPGPANTARTRTSSPGRTASGHGYSGATTIGEQARYELLSELRRHLNPTRLAEMVPVVIGQG